MIQNNNKMQPNGTLIIISKESKRKITTDIKHILKLNVWLLPWIRMEWIQIRQMHLSRSLCISSILKSFCAPHNFFFKILGALCVQIRHSLTFILFHFLAVVGVIFDTICEHCALWWARNRIFWLRNFVCFRCKQKKWDEYTKKKTKFDYFNFKRRSFGYIE